MKFLSSAESGLLIFRSQLPTPKGVSFHVPTLGGWCGFPALKRWAKICCLCGTGTWFVPRLLLHDESLSLSAGGLKGAGLTLYRCSSWLIVQAQAAGWSSATTRPVFWFILIWRRTMRPSA